MAINETLKFSWGHIIAFLALIFINYLSFMGLTYMTDGNFIVAGLGVVIIDVLLLSVFLGVQLLKSTERKFSKRIILERVLLFLTPLVFFLCFLPQAHFWTVFDQREEIEGQFTESVINVKNIFVSYEQYVDKRISDYKRQISKTDKSVVSRTNKIEALTLQLKSDNYYNLKNAAIEWIDKASGATVWNVFMIGNIKTISEAVKGWKTSLIEVSKKKMSGEVCHTYESNKIDSMEEIECFSNINKIYSVKKPKKLYVWIIMVVLYGMLIFPYLIQNRHIKSSYSIIGIAISRKRSKSVSVKNIGVEKLEAKLQIEKDLDDDNDDYGSFTIN